MFYFYCPNCKKETIVNKLPKKTIPNTRDGWGQPIYHYECDNCHNLDAGFMKLKDNTIEEKQYFQFVISKYQNIRGFNK